MSSLRRELMDFITPERERNYERFKKGEIIAFNNSQWFRAFYYYYSFGKWWNSICDGDEYDTEDWYTYEEYDNPCSAAEFIRCNFIEINMTRLLDKIHNNHILIFNLDGEILSKFYYVNQKYYKGLNEIEVTDIDKFLTNIIVVLAKGEYGNYYMEKSYNYEQSHELVSTLIKNYYKNSVVKLNTLTGMNKIYDDYQLCC
jgi:hypothetical protein